MRQIAILLFLLPVISLIAQKVEAPEHAEPGEMIQIAVLGNNLKDVSVSLLNINGKALSRSESFPWTSASGQTCHVLLLGIPTSVSPGRYQLKLSAIEGRADRSFQKYLTIREHQYPENVINLNSTMNSLYTDTSERKKQEAKEFWALISSFNPNSIHHTESFTNPISDAFITSAFGERRRYRMPDGSESTSIHFGRDLRGAIGTPVYAAGRGRVVMAKSRLITGNTVILEHLPGVYSLYSHLDSFSVQLGEMVSQGQIIAKVGQTGFSTATHLHWEIRVGGVPVSPQQFLDEALLDTKWLISIMKEQSSP